MEGQQSGLRPAQPQGGSLSLKQRLGKAILEFSSHMMPATGGALVQVGQQGNVGQRVSPVVPGLCSKHVARCLSWPQLALLFSKRLNLLCSRCCHVQVWMPEQLVDGTVVLSAQGSKQQDLCVSASGSTQLLDVLCAVTTHHAHASPCSQASHSRWSVLKLLTHF